MEIIPPAAHNSNAAATLPVPFKTFEGVTNIPEPE